MELEQLVKLGIAEDVAKQVLKLHKESIDGNYVPKATFEAERTKVKDRDTQIAERDKQISDLGSFKGDAEALKLKVDKLTEENATAKKEYDEKIAKLEVESAIRLEIADKVFSTDDILPKLDATKLTIKEGKIVAGLSEQLTEIQKSSPHYFKKVESGPEDSKGGLPEGWTPFGKNPAENSKPDSTDGSTNLGMQLAKSISSSDNIMQTANDTYFK